MVSFTGGYSVDSSILVVDQFCDNCFRWFFCFCGYSSFVMIPLFWWLVISGGETFHCHVVVCCNSSPELSMVDVLTIVAAPSFSLMCLFNNNGLSMVKGLCF